MTRFRIARIALVPALALALAGCATTTAYTPPAMDYPPGAFRKPDGTPRPLPCIAVPGFVCSS